MKRITSPPFLLLFMGLCLLAMLAASVQRLLALPAPPIAQAIVAEAPSSPPPSGEQNDKDGSAPPSALSDEQSDTVSGLMGRLKDNPNDAGALTEIGEAFLEAKDWSRAGIFLARAIKASPNDTRPRYLMGNSLYQQGNMQEAAKVFEELLAIKTDAAAQYNLAVLYKYYLNRATDARNLFRTLAESQKNGADIQARAKKELEQ